MRKPELQWSNPALHPPILSSRPLFGCGRLGVVSQLLNLGKNYAARLGLELVTNARFEGSLSDSSFGFDCQPAIVCTGHSIIIARRASYIVINDLPKIDTNRSWYRLPSEYRAVGEPNYSHCRTRLSFQISDNLRIYQGREFLPRDLREFENSCLR